MVIRKTKTNRLVVVYSIFVSFCLFETFHGCRCCLAAWLWNSCNDWWRRAPCRAAKKKPPLWLPSSYGYKSVRQNHDSCPPQFVVLVHLRARWVPFTHTHTHTHTHRAVVLTVRLSSNPVVLIFFLAVFSDVPSTIIPPPLLSAYYRIPVVTGYEVNETGRRHRFSSSSSKWTATAAARRRRHCPFLRWSAIGKCFSDRWAFRWPAIGGRHRSPVLRSAPFSPSVHLPQMLLVRKQCARAQLVLWHSAGISWSAGSVQFRRCSH